MNRVQDAQNSQGQLPVWPSDDSDSEDSAVDFLNAQNLNQFGLQRTADRTKKLYLVIGSRWIELTDQRFTSSWKSLSDELNQNGKESDLCYDMKTMNFSKVNVKTGKKELLNGVPEYDNDNTPRWRNMQAVAECAQTVAEQHWPKAGLPNIRDKDSLNGCNSFSTKPGVERNSPLLQKILPTGFSESAKRALEIYCKSEPDVNKQNAALKRIVQVERHIYLRDLIAQKKLNNKREELQRKKEELAQAGQNDKARLKSEYEDLKNQYKNRGKLGDIDRFALFAAAAFAPDLDTQPPKTLSEQVAQAELSAQNLRKELITALSAENRSMLLGSWTPSFMSGDPQSDPLIEKYSTQAALRVFCVLPAAYAREEIQAFSREHGGFPQVHDLGDDALRMMLQENVVIPLNGAPQSSPRYPTMNKLGDKPDYSINVPGADLNRILGDPELTTLDKKIQELQTALTLAIHNYVHGTTEEALNNWVNREAPAALAPPPSVPRAPVLRPAPALAPALIPDPNAAPQPGFFESGVNWFTGLFEGSGNGNKQHRSGSILFRGSSDDERHQDDGIL